MKVKDFKKLSNKEIYSTLQSNSTKYDNPMKFISWLHLLEKHHILSAKIWGKTFRKRSDAHEHTTKYYSWGLNGVEY